MLFSECGLQSRPWAFPRRERRRLAQQKRLLRLYEQGEPVSELTSMFGISRSTLFRTLKVLKQRESASV